jgi:hypothetical protein
MLMASCTTQKRCHRLYPCQGSVIERTDSVTIIVEKIIPRDTTIYVSDSNLVRAYLSCDSLGNVYLNQIKTLKAGSYISTSIALANNQMDITSKIDSAAVVIAWTERHVTQTTSVDRSREETIIVKEPTGWQWFQIWTGRILTIILLLTIIYFAIKLWMKKR